MMGMGRDVGVMRMSESRLLDALPRHAVAREGAAHLARCAVDGDLCANQPVASRRWRGGHDSRLEI